MSLGSAMMLQPLKDTSPESSHLGGQGCGLIELRCCCRTQLWTRRK